MGRISSLLLPATVLLLSLGFQNTLGYPDGADPSVCGSMKPSHGPPPQTSENPYQIVLSKTSVKGFEQVNITLKSRNENDIFKGFLIQVRKPGGEKSIGKFSDTGADSNVKTLKCFGIADSAVTQTSNKDKKSVTATWIAPNDEDGEYQIYYTVVGINGFSYWSAINHPQKVQVTRDLQAKAPSPVAKALSPDTLANLRKVYRDCGETKGCFGMPNGCVSSFDSASDDPTVCDMMVTWENQGDKFMYQLSGKTRGSGYYIAVGFSEDDKMGKDSVVGCAYVENELPIARRYYNPSQSNTIHTRPTHGLVQNQPGSIQDGILTCEFQQENHRIDELGMDFDFTKRYHLLLSRSSISADRIATGLSKHDADTKIASTVSVDITDTVIIGASNNNWLIQLHGGLMLIAWLLCASTGMFTARYLKLTHTDFMPFGKAFWFALHVFCMASTAFLTICGAIFILIRKKGLDLKEVHPILGVVVIALAIFQVIMALLRPHPGTKYRPMFNWLHWGVGNSAHIVGIACIFMAYELDLAQLKRFNDENLWNWIMMAIVLFHVLMHIVMSIHTLWADKEMDTSKNKKRAMFPGPMKPNGMSSEAPGSAFRTFMLGLYLVVMGAGVIALICLVFWPNNKKDDDVTS